MKIINLVLIFFCFVSSFGGEAIASIYHKGWIDLNKNGIKDIYEDSRESIDKRVENLLSLMTLDEKVAQCVTLYGYQRFMKDALPQTTWKCGLMKDGIANIDEHLNGLRKTEYAYPYSKHAKAINEVQRWFIEKTRLGIPADFSNEAIHGLNHEKSTPLPAPIAIGSTWDKALVRIAGEIVGREAKVLGYTNVYAPILDLARDPRWGRVLECYGEDPFLVATLGAEMVEGIQSKGVASTLKHYAVYSVPKGGRDGYTRVDPHVCPRALHQLHLAPYRYIIKRSHPLGVMCSYNDWDGIPIAASYYFLTTLLREEYGFEGYLISDSGAVEMVFNKHRVAASHKDAVRQVVEAGLNVRTNFSSPLSFMTDLKSLVKEGDLKESILDKNVGDVLRVKFKLGLFDAPYVKDIEQADEVVANKEAQDFVKEMARKSIVLLKNKDDLLPLSLSNTKRILVTGPLAIDKSAYVSRYGPQNIEVTNVLEGIQKYVGKKATVFFEKGCDVVDKHFPESDLMPFPWDSKEEEMIEKAVDKALLSDIVIAVLGEDEKRCGENKSRTSLNLPGRQRALLQALKKTGKPIVLVLINGQPLTINWANKHIPAIVEAWFPNSEGGNAIAEVLFGAVNPSGKLPITFPKTVGQIEWNFPYKPWSHGWQAQTGNNGTGVTSVNGALYPFGFGLSYTTFNYSNLEITPSTCLNDGEVKITFDVTNTGKRVGEEVSQVYFRDKVSRVMTYDLQLRGYERIRLQPNETKQLTFILKTTDFELLDKKMNWIVEPGEMEILVGSSSRDIRLKQTFELIE